MTADAGKAAFEDLKRLSGGLLDFVAADTRLPPEIALRVMISIGKAVRLSAGTAAAAVYFEKPLEQVTGVEAHSGPGAGCRRGRQSRSGLERLPRSSSAGGLFVGAGDYPPDTGRARHGVKPAPG